MTTLSSHSSPWSGPNSEMMDHSHQASWYNSTFFSQPPENRRHYYNLPKSHTNERKFFCETCNKNFYSWNQYQTHINNHVDCPFPNCKMKADFKVIDQHINHQHLLVNFDSFQIDDETWIKERKKRFPSQKRAELRRAQQMQRLQRGERMPMDEKKNGKLKREPAIKSQTRHRKNNKRTQKILNHDEPVEIDMYDSDCETKFEVMAFKGTNSFYESTGELNCLSSSSKVDCESAFSISDEEDDWNKPSQENKVEKVVLNNALGSLMGAYDSDSDVDPPDETPIPRNVEEPDKTPLDSKNVSSARKRKRPTKFKKEVKSFKGPCKNKPQKLRHPSLLQRLLSSEIRHERNVILQCVRHVVLNNFFDDST